MTPGATGQNQRARDARRRALLDAARGVFARRGLAATRMADIADAAGTSVGLAYRYFPSKEALFAAVIERALEGSVRLVDEALGRPDSALDQLAWLLDQMLAGLRQTPDYGMLVVQAFASDAVPAEVRERLQRAGTRTQEGLVRLIRQGQESGDIVPGDPLELATVLMATVQGLGLALLAAEDAQRPFPAVETVLRLLRA